MANSFVRYTGNASTTAFAIPFSYRTSTDLTVTIAGTASTAYTLNAAGTTLTFNTAPADASAIEIRRTTSQTARLTDYADGSVLTENDLDTDSEQAFFMSQEAIDDAKDVISLDNSDFQYDVGSKRLKNVTNPTAAQDAVTKNYLESTWLSASDKTNLTAVAGVSTQMGLLGTSDAVSDMNTLATADIISDMNTLATSDIISDLNTLAASDIVTDMNTLATSANVTAMGLLGNSTTVTNMGLLGTSAVVTDLGLLGTSAVVTDLDLLATSANVTAMGLLGNSTTVTNLGLLGTSTVVSNIATVAGKNTEIGLLGTSANATAIGLLGTSAVIADINTLATSDIVSDLNTLASSGIVEDLNILATSANVTAMGLLGVSAVVTDMDLLGTSANVTNMATLGTSANVTSMGLLGTSAVVTDLGILGTADVVTDMNVLATADVVADMNTLGTADVVADMNTLGTADNVTNMNTVADNLTAVNNFADQYRIASSAPTSSLTAGDLYFDTTSNTLKVYSASGWQNAGSSVNGTSARYKYVATASQTTFSGADANGDTLAYDSGYIDVYLNGVHLDPTDYTATSGTSIVLGAGATLNDELYVVGFGTFNVAAVAGSAITSGTINEARLTNPTIPNKVEGTNFTGSLLIGHATTGTLSSASNNTAVGINTLNAITSGVHNTAMGFEASGNLTGGGSNTNIGRYAGNSNQTASHNTSIGYDALRRATGGNNTSIGSFSGDNIGSGVNNITVGKQAANNITSGDGNVIIGSIDADSATGDKQLIIADGVDGSVAWLKGDSSGNIVTQGTVTANGQLLGAVITPTISSISPSTIENTATDVVITGTNYGSSGVPNVEIINSNGVISYPNTITRNSATQLTINVTIATDASYFLRIELENGNAVRSSTAILTVSDAPVISTVAGSLGSFAKGTAISVTVAGTGDATLVWSSTGTLPTGLSLNTSTGVISGTESSSITQATTYSNIQVTLTDGQSQATTKTFSITITVYDGSTGGGQFN